MVAALISIIVLLILVVIAVRIGLNREKVDEPVQEQLIHASGIYSIVRRSPRDGIIKVKPNEQEIRKYLEELNENIGKFLLSEQARSALVSLWSKSINKSIEVVEHGDKEGVEFYYYDYDPEQCPECEPYISKGQFVSREEIFRHPQVIPPFHLGCRCFLVPYHGKENLRETTELGMIPLFEEDEVPPLPDWKLIHKTEEIKGTTA